MNAARSTLKASRSRRGFALPLVVFLAFIAALAAGILLDLQSTSRLAVDRQVASYRHHHTALGVRELLDQWLQIAMSSGIDAQLDENHMAFELEGATGESTRVYLFDGQGSALRDAGGAGGDRATLAQTVATILADAPPGSEPFLRPFGPLKISIGSAPPRVLEAVVTAAGNPGRAAVFAQDIAHRRQERKLTDSDITDAAQKAGLQQAEAAAVASMFTASPELWRIEVVSGRPGTRQPRVRQGGLMQIPADHSLGSSTVIILSWEDLPDDR